MEGHLTIQGLQYNFLKTEHTHNLFKQNSFSYLTFRIIKPVAFLDVKLKNVKSEMIFGEIQRCILNLNNVKNQKIDDLIIHCEEPLFTGWRMKRFGHNKEEKRLKDKLRYKALTEGEILQTNLESETQILEEDPAINARENYEIHLDLRATMIQIQNLCFTIYYKTEGEWRIKCFFIELDIQSSFRIKCMTETLEPNKRLICIDFLYKCGPAINWEDVFIDKIYLLSNSWKFVKGTEVVSKRDGIFMIYLIVEEGQNVDEEILKLTRKERELWLNDDNTIGISKDFEEERLESLINFLKHENIELRNEGSNNEFCKDFVDLAILWNIKNSDKEKGEMGEIISSGLHSVTSVSMKSIASLSKAEKKEKERSRIKLYIETEKKISHNFSDSHCKKKVKIIVDCSNLTKKAKRISMRALEPYEMPGDDGNVYVNMDNDKELFNWSGKHEFVIESPFSETHVIEIEVIYPKIGVFDLNSFFFKDLDSGEIIESIVDRGQFFVSVEEGLL